ncbi:MAG: A/G-specific adenine glycosylase, partial [Verrucomicrobiales bacterium]|nr:A/G-specific adenine glycosylase [Verrucomicrobiales bacterium]
MLQQTQVRTVIPYWERWMRAFPTVADLAKATEPTVLKLWEGLGYYRRARHLHAAAKQLFAETGGRFPTDREGILALPGVGRYTAGAIHSIAFNQPSPILDGNVIRVLTRWQGLTGDPAVRAVNQGLWEDAQRLVEAAAELRRPEACSHLNQSLMELGATVCTPRAPRCHECPVAGSCRA